MKHAILTVCASCCFLPLFNDAHAAPQSNPAPAATPCARPIADSKLDLVVSFPSSFTKSEIRVSADGRVITYREQQPATAQTPQRTRHVQALLANQMFITGYSTDFKAPMGKDIVCATSNLQPLTWASLGNDLQRQMANASSRLAATVPAPTAAQRLAFNTAQSALLTSLGRQSVAVANENGAVRYGILEFGSQKNPIFLVIDFKQGILFGWTPSSGVIAKALFTDAQVTHYSKYRPLEKARFQSIMTDLADLTAKALKLSPQAPVAELASWVGREITK